jgi:hypothetical protein
MHICVHMHECTSVCMYVYIVLVCAAFRCLCMYVQLVKYARGYVDTHTHTHIGRNGELYFTVKQKCAISDHTR